MHYGGASFDAMDAWKYIGGKTAMLPPGSYPCPNKIHNWSANNSLCKDIPRSRWPSGQRFHLLWREVSRWNPSNLPLLHMWHVGNATGCDADLCTVSRCRTRGESQEFMAHRWQSTQARDPPWLWNPGDMSSEVQNRGISGLTKRTHVFQKLKKKDILRAII